MLIAALCTFQDALGQCDVRPAQQKLLLEAIYIQRQKSVTNSSATIFNPTGRQVEAGFVTQPVRGPHSEEFKSWRGLDLNDSVPPHSQSIGSINNIKSSTMGGVNTTKPALAKRALSATKRRPPPPTPEFQTLGGTTGSMASALSCDSRNAVEENNAICAKATSCFNPDGFIPFVHLKSPNRPTEIVDEVDMRKLMARIGSDLGKKNDWEARTNALIALQKLAWGNLTDFKSCVEAIKGMHELV